MEAPAEDREHMGQVATAFEEMLQALEAGKTSNFSLVENEKRASLSGAALAEVNSKRRNTKRSNARSIQDADSASQPRYL